MTGLARAVAAGAAADADASPPDATVVVPVLDGARDLPALLACLEAQTLAPTRWEAIVVDNGSADGTRALAGSRVEPWRVAGRALRVLCEPIVKSSYAARNLGIRAARAPVIAFTDADCRPEPRWLEELLAPFADPGVSIAAGAVRAAPGETVLERFAARRGILSQEAVLSSAHRPYGQTANLAVRRSVFEVVGLFRPRLDSGGDADLCWRVLEGGRGRIASAPGAVVLHRHRDTLRGLWAQFRRYGRSERWLDALHGSGEAPRPGALGLARMLGGWLLRRVPRALARAAAGRGDALDLFETPLAVVCLLAKGAGARSGPLPEAARAIERLEGARA